MAVAKETWGLAAGEEAQAELAVEAVDRLLAVDAEAVNRLAAVVPGNLRPRHKPSTSAEQSNSERSCLLGLNATS